MSKIIAIGTAVPVFKQEQENVLDFMQRAYVLDAAGKRKLKFLYKQAGINARYTIIPDFCLPANEWQFFSPSENLEPVPSIEQRMEWYRQHAAPLSMEAIDACMADSPDTNITHLITVSCTGISAPGLDIELLQLLGLPHTTFRTSVNFMGCYAAIHALKLADAFCRADIKANVLIVCTELCSLHFQQAGTMDNIISGLLFADGAAAVLVSGKEDHQGLHIDHFYSTVATRGIKEMAWELSSTGFQMTLSGNVPDLIAANLRELVNDALAAATLRKENITHWCVHPGGKKILEAVRNSLGFNNDELQHSSEVLRDYGNMSSPTILFVLKKIMDTVHSTENGRVFGVAFGPGLTMETFILSV